MTSTAVALKACAWCRQPLGSFPSGGPAFCCRLHQDWWESIARGGFPVADCPRCGSHDLRIAGPDWAICQTCGYQTDRPDLPVGVLTPRNMNSSMSDIKNRLAQSTEQ